MSAEHGAYVELLQKGEIKRDLAEVSCEVSLDGTTISDAVGSGEQFELGVDAAF